MQKAGKRIHRINFRQCTRDLLKGTWSLPSFKVFCVCKLAHVWEWINEAMTLFLLFRLNFSSFLYLYRSSKNVVNFLSILLQGTTWLTGQWDKSACVILFLLLLWLCYPITVATPTMLLAAQCHQLAAATLGSNYYFCCIWVLKFSEHSSHVRSGLQGRAISEMLKIHFLQCWWNVCLLNPLRVGGLFFRNKSTLTFQSLYIFESHSWQ